MSEPRRAHYRVIYADPPWHFTTYSAKGQGRGAVAHYDCMKFEEMARLPIDTWAADDAVLFLWATDPLLPQAFRLIEAWGFTFKTIGFYWAKLNKSANLERITEKDFFAGLGYWTRANTEQCLLATRGKPSRSARDVRRLIVSHRREHSRKPDEVYQRIERLVDGPYLELFGRSSRKTWDCWGDQKTLFDRGVPVRTRRFASDLARHARNV